MSRMLIYFTENFCPRHLMVSEDKSYQEFALSRFSNPHKLLLRLLSISQKTYLFNFIEMRLHALNGHFLACLY